MYIRAAKISRAKYDNLYGKYSYEELYDKIKKSSDQIYNLNYDLPVDKDFNEHSVEVLLNQLPLGFYVLFVSDNEGFEYEKAMSAFQAFTVSNISYVKQQQYDGSFRYVVLNRTTGMPMQGVTCQSWYSKYSYSKRRYVEKMGKVYTTDKDGSFVINAVKGNDSQSWNVNFSFAGDYLTTANSSYIYYQPHDKYSNVYTTFFTDRAIYRPGQTIYFKGISIRSDGETNKIETGYNVTVVLKDVNHQKVAELSLKTNEYGTFSGTFDIPTGLLNGNFLLECYNGSKYISVEEYKRPKFEVEMLPFKGNYLLNDEVEVEGKATSYSGAAISEANVKYRIIRTPQ
ncbi:MAG: hypothetical protein HC831_11635, partial [Chloroflexia bacterium]|nr:hypothetical protein [Chloroflexia bacterium]